jgi:hypothetical protein
MKNLPAVGSMVLFTDAAWAEYTDGIKRRGMKKPGPLPVEEHHTQLALVRIRGISYFWFRPDEIEQTGVSISHVKKVIKKLLAPHRVEIGQVYRDRDARRAQRKFTVVSIVTTPEGEEATCESDHSGRKCVVKTSRLQKRYQLVVS